MIFKYCSQEIWLSRLISFHFNFWVLCMHLHGMADVNQKERIIYLITFKHIVALQQHTVLYKESEVQSYFRI